VSSPEIPPPGPHPPRPVPPRQYNGPRDDVRMSIPEGDDDTADPPLSLVPLDPEIPAVRPIHPLADRRFERPPMARETAERWQFTLAHLLIANSLLAVILALSHWMAPSLLAGALGLAAFGMILFVTVYQPDQARMYSLAWTLIVVYLLAAGVALLRG
jgi:hypothetical protein